MNKGKTKRQSIIQLILLLSILILVNLISQFAFFRIDMTQEKRYSLSGSSKELARNLKDVVYFKIYLDGDLPPGFKHFRNAIKEVLDEYRVYGGDNITYEFIDPSANPDEKERVKLYKQLAEKGLYPTNLQQQQGGGQSQKIIFPGAIVNYKSKEIPLQLLKSRIGSSPEEMLNISIEGLEYEITSLLRKLTKEKSIHVGFLQGQNELPTINLADAATGLNDFYIIDTVQINEQLHALDKFKTLIVARPDTAFSEKDKFILDQFVMKGGRILWLLDKVSIQMDSLGKEGITLALPNDLNIDDMLFKYGVRVNPDLVMDMYAAPIPIVTGYVGNQPKQEVFPWYYFPLVESAGKHPISNNLNAIKLEFANTIDTIETDSVTKTVLLTTSKKSRIQTSPARVSLSILRDEPDPSLFTKAGLPVAVLLEGSFVSNYKNRIPDAIRNSPEINFKERSVRTKMIVVSDGDIISNYVSKKGAIYPLGYDRITRQTYGNRNLILNAVDYLCDQTDILELRGKEFKIRLLDPAKTQDLTLIRWMNILLPSIAVLAFGLIFTFLRKRKYQTK